jgi:hypothetical protein
MKHYMLNCRDKAHIILNEGQSRGLPLHLKRAIERLNLPVWQKRSQIKIFCLALATTRL